MQIWYFGQNNNLCLYGAGKQLNSIYLFIYLQDRKINGKLLRV